MKLWLSIRGFCLAKGSYTKSKTVRLNETLFLFIDLSVGILALFD